MSYEIEETVGTLVREGAVREGSFRVPFRTPDFERVDLTGFGPCVPVLRARQRFWFGFALTHPEVHLATIAIDLGVATVSSFYTYDRPLRRFCEHEAIVLGSRGRVAKHPWNDRSFVHAARHRVDFHHELDQGRHTLSIDVEATKTAPAVRAELVMHENLDAHPPLVTSVPTEGRWFMYTHKGHAPASGFVRIGDREFDVDPARDLLSIDEHKAAYPYAQEWVWGSLAGRDADGRILALNLCTNVHYRDEERGNENRLWAGGEMHPLGAVTFDFDASRPLEPWRISDRHGRVDLVFVPDGRKEQHTGGGPYRLDYFQAYGRYRGRVVDSIGREHRIDDLFGVAEQGIGRN